MSNNLPVECTVTGLARQRQSLAIRVQCNRGYWTNFMSIKLLCICIQHSLWLYQLPVWFVTCGCFVFGKGLLTSAVHSDNFLDIICNNRSILYTLKCSRNPPNHPLQDQAIARTKKGWIVGQARKNPSPGTTNKKCYKDIFDTDNVWYALSQYNWIHYQHYSRPTL